MRASILLIAVLVAATACAPGNVRLTRQDFSSEYGAGQFAYAGAGRDFRVDVVGNPFGGDQTAFGQIVTEAMQGRIGVRRRISQRIRDPTRAKPIGW